MAAAVAALDVTAKRRGAAAFDRAHGTALRGGQRCAVPLAIDVTVLAEYVRHFRPVAGHDAGPSGGGEDRCGGDDTT